MKASVPRPPVSVIITCFNAEREIRSCIESVLWAEEILVVDSFSSDRTPEIARGYDRVRLLQRPYYGGASQKNWALDRVRHDWVLILDVDERCTPQLGREIEELLACGPGHQVYTIARRVYFLGRRIRFSGWRNDRVVRLFRRDAARYPNLRVHSVLEHRGAAPILKNPMEHFMIRELDEYVRRIAKYGYWGAAQAWRDGVRAGFIDLLPRSLWRFVRTYVVQFGFLDGLRGLVFCLLQAFGTFVKWATLWGWQINAARGIEPRLPEFDEDRSVWLMPDLDMATPRS